MPIYEYTCSDCQGAFEVLVRGDEVPVCPACGATELSKQFSVPAAHTSGTTSLPISSPASMGGGCGLPQCGAGRCGMQ